MCQLHPNDDDISEFEEVDEEEFEFEEEFVVVSLLLFLKGNSFVVECREVSRVVGIIAVVVFWDSEDSFRVTIVFEEFVGNSMVDVPLLLILLGLAA